ncbi:hypothetical protein IWX92DRAFT_358292 [Phyllosticta citricarpa]
MHPFFFFFFFFLVLKAQLTNSKRLASESPLRHSNETEPPRKTLPEMPWSTGCSASSCYSLFFLNPVVTVLAHESKRVMSIRPRCFLP